MRDIEQLNYYIKKKLDLIPLRKPTGDSQGKEPLQKEWQTKDYSVDDIKSFFNKGYNIGFRLGRNHLIVDCDPRNYGKENSLDKLMSFLGINLFTVCTYVKTGSGGYHFYMTLDRDVRLLNELKDRFPGIEFKTHGRQVVCAGCETIHGEYRFGNITSDFTAPGKLIDLLTVKSVSSSSAGSSEDKYISNDELRDILNLLPIEDYQSNDEWSKIMFGSHHATRGEGLDVFLEWSLSDPKYADDESKIVTRWNSINDDTMNNITIGTLLNEVKCHGKEYRLKTKDFDNITDCEDEEEEEFTIADEDFNAEEEFTVEETEEDKEGYPEPSQNNGKSKIALNLANKITKSSKDSDIVTAIKSALAADEITQRIALETIRSNLDISEDKFAKLSNRVRMEMLNYGTYDLAHCLAMETLKHKFHNSDWLINSVNKQFWWFNGKYWKVVTNDYVDKNILHELEQFKKKLDPCSKINEKSLYTQASGFIRTRTAQCDDVLDLKGEPKPVINCQNGELWIEEDAQSKITTKFINRHNADSHLLSVTDIVYDPEAKCPQYDKALHEIFRNLPDCEDVIRHWYEIIGYILYPNKNLAHFFLLRGNGGDGKSTMMKIISAMLGDAVLPESIERFRTGTGSDSHATASLVGKLLVFDDDVNKSVVLPDGVLKKLSERGKMTANPKGFETYTFTKISTVVLCCNGFPKTKDVSEGFKRRAMVVPFNRHFTADEMDLNIAQRIIGSELSGIFNKALEGLKRLHERGKFDPPRSCEDAKNRWLNSASSIFEFISECVDKTSNNSDKEKLSDLYARYQRHCTETNISRVMTKKEFEDSMEIMNFPSKKTDTHTRLYFGIKLKNENCEEFENVKDDENDESMFQNQF